MRAGTAKVLEITAFGCTETEKGGNAPADMTVVRRAHELVAGDALDSSQGTRFREPEEIFNRDTKLHLIARLCHSIARNQP